MLSVSVRDSVSDSVVCQGHIIRYSYDDNVTSQLTTPTAFQLLLIIVLTRRTYNVSVIL